MEKEVDFEMRAVDLNDKQAYSPKWSLNGGLSYRIKVGEGSITPRAVVRMLLRMKGLRLSKDPTTP